ETVPAPRYHVKPVAKGSVGDLVVVLKAIEERTPGHRTRGGATRLADARIELALVEEALANGPGELGQLAIEPCEVAVAFPRERGAKAMVEVIGPDRIEAEAAGVDGGDVADVVL